MSNTRVIVCSLAVFLMALRNLSILHRLFSSQQEDREQLLMVEASLDPMTIPPVSDALVVDAVDDDTPSNSSTTTISPNSSSSSSTAAQSQQQQDNASTGPPRIAYMTYSFLATPDNFERMIFPSLDTWLLDDNDNDDNSRTTPYYFVVLNAQWKQAYQDLCFMDAKHQRYCARIHPIFVDNNKCPEAKWGESPCCKQQEGLLYMIDSTFLINNYDWFVFQDDDMYLRRAYLQDFLQPLLNNTTTVPMIATSGGVRRAGRGRSLGQEGYAPHPAYRCRVKDHDFTYPWGQPVVYNRAALWHIASGLRAGGLVQQCLEFNVTHDVGNAIFHWMYRLPEVRFRVPFFPPNNNNNKKKKNAATKQEGRLYHDGRLMGVHGVAKRTKDGDALSMAEVHDKFRDLPHPPVESHTWFRANGFLQTETYKKYGDPSTWSEWHTMPTRDCMAEPSDNNNGGGGIEVSDPS